MKRMENEEYLVVVSGPSGCGKDTVVSELMRLRPGIKRSVSCTSRPKRGYETDGRHYRFVTRDEFLRLIACGEMLEYTEYSGNYYGTPLGEVEPRLKRKETVVLVIETNGAKKIKKMFPGSLLVFIIPPSVEELRRRLKLRNTETEAEQESRLEIAKEEMSRTGDYDRVIENGDVDLCAERLWEEIVNWQKDRRGGN